MHREQRASFEVVELPSGDTWETDVESQRDTRRFWYQFSRRQMMRMDIGLDKVRRCRPEKSYGACVCGKGWRVARNREKEAHAQQQPLLPQPRLFVAVTTGLLSPAVVFQVPTCHDDSSGRPRTLCARIALASDVCVKLTHGFHWRRDAARLAHCGRSCLGRRKDGRCLRERHDFQSHQARCPTFLRLTGWTFSFGAHGMKFQDFTFRFDNLHGVLRPEMAVLEHDIAIIL